MGCNGSDKVKYIETKSEFIAKTHTKADPATMKTILVEDGIIAKFGRKPNNSDTYKLLSVSFQKSFFDDETIETVKEYMKGVRFILTNKKNKKYCNVAEDRIDKKTVLRFVVIDNNPYDDDE